MSSLPPVPPLTLEHATDIRVFIDVPSFPVAFGSSFKGTRPVKEFLELLKMIISPDDFHLETLPTREIVDVDCVIAPGDYIAVGQSNLAVFPLATFKRAIELLACHGASPHRKRKSSQIDQAEAARSERDSSKETDGFKSRLRARDRGCVVCMALSQDDDAMYLYEVDSEFFEGAHIFPLQYYQLWDSYGRSSLVQDPYSVPGASKSSTSRSSTDLCRMNAIDNGLLLCLRHHKEFDAHLFSIHPETHIVTSFHPRTKSINGLKITQPWESNCDPRFFPPPHDTLLLDHFQASLAWRMKAAAEEYEEEDSFEDEDEDEIEELTGVSDDSCLIAADYDQDIVLPPPGSKRQREC